MFLEQNLVMDGQTDWNITVCHPQQGRDINKKKIKSFHESRESSRRVRFPYHQ